MCFAATFCRYNMGSPSVNQLSWEDCCAACASDTNCAAWTWHKLFGAEPPRKPKCFLSAAKNVKAHSGGVDTCTSVPVYLFPRREHAYHPIVRVHTVQSTSVRSFAHPPSLSAARVVVLHQHMTHNTMTHSPLTTRTF